MSDYKIIHADCLEAMPTLPENSVDSVVTDPPYGLSFMGKDWDHGVPGAEFWKAALRVMKPGAYLLAFGGTRTFHRLTVAIEDAGFEVRDCLMWLYGSGFPKSLDVSKAIDKAAGAERSKTFSRRGAVNPEGFKPGSGGAFKAEFFETAPSTDAAKQWSGWGTALKPAWEPIILARKPIEGTVAENVQTWGTGAINIDGSRIETSENLNGGAYSGELRKREEYSASDSSPGAVSLSRLKRGSGEFQQPSGRWPANVLLDEEAGRALDGQSGIEASRFFYCSKASKRERGEGNTHPTVKPQALLQYLAKLITPPNGLILDPFNGSGSMAIAAIDNGFKYIGIEKEKAYVDIANGRIEDHIFEKE